MYIKKEMGKSKLSMTDWPCHVWLLKKNSLALYALIWMTGFCLLYHQTIIFMRGNGVCQRWSMCCLRSRNMSEIHFPAIWRPKFQKFSPWCPTDSGVLNAIVPILCNFAGFISVKPMFLGSMRDIFLQ